MKFDEMVEMYMEEFLATKDTTQYMKKNKGYSTCGPDKNLRRKRPITVPNGFKGDVNGTNTVIIKNLFPMGRN